MADALQVSTTTDSEEAARALAALLVGERLAACVQVVGPIVSTYWWEGRVETAQEWLCLVKTRADRYPEVEEAIRRHHSYDVPEIIAVPAVEIDESYRQWLLETVPPPAG